MEVVAERVEARAPRTGEAREGSPRGRRWAALLVGAALLPLANGHYSVPLAAWLAPLLLLRFSRGQPPGAGALALFLLQMAALALQFRGMVPVPWAAYFPVMALYALASTLPYLADRMLDARLGAWGRTLVFPAAWVSAEFLVSWGPFGSWMAVGYSQYGNLPLLQLLSVTGLLGLTFLIGWAAAAGNAVWEEWPRGSRIPAAAKACAGTIAGVLLVGGGRLALFPPAANTVRVASLTGAGSDPHPDPAVTRRFFRQAELTPAEVAVIRGRMRADQDDLLRRAEREARAGARIVFWGEANAAVMRDEEDAFVQRGRALAQATGAYVGMAMASWHLESAPPLENKIVLVQPDGGVAWEYAKARPVPGAEAALSRPSDGRLRTLDTPYGRLGGVICFDADFPRLLAQAGRAGVDLVLDPSNDWRAIDPWHTRMASFRAIEQGFNLVRQTSGGLSAAFDYQGRVLGTMDHYTSDERTLVARVPTRGVRTVYSRLGDWMAWPCLLGLAALAASAGARGTRHSSGR